MCEGDDYWSDCEKLQKQYDALELHKNCSICTHIVQHVDENGNKVDKTQPNLLKIKDLIDDLELKPLRIFELIFVDHIMPFQTSSFFFRKKVCDEIVKNKPTFCMCSPVGDLPLLLLCCLFGNVYFISKKMSCYREGSVGSWTSKISTKNIVNLRRKNIDSIKEFNIYSKCKYNDILINYIYYLEYQNLVLQKKYKNLFFKCYKPMLKKETKLRVLYFYILSICPRLEFIEKLYKKVKKYD